MQQRKVEGVLLNQDNQIIEDIFLYLKQVELEGFTSESWYLDCLPLHIQTGLTVSREYEPVLLKTDITGKQRIQTSITISYQTEISNANTNPLLKIETTLLKEQENLFSNLTLTNANMIAIDKVTKQRITQTSSNHEHMSITYQVIYQTKGEL